MSDPNQIPTPPACSRRGHGSQLSAKMNRAVDALLTYRTLEEAAQAAHISRSTLKRWMADLEFRAAYLATRDQMQAETMARLQQQAHVFAAVLLQALADPAAPPAAKVRAAKAILEIGRRGAELDRIDLRLSKLERAAQSAAPGATPATATGKAPSRGHGSQFPRKMEAAVSALLTQRNLDEAARMAGISVSTLKRWKHRPEFQGALQQACRRAMGETSAVLQRYTHAALAVLSNIAADAHAPVGLRVSAAHFLLKLGQRYLAQQDFEPRLVALERAAAQKPAA